MKVLRENCPQCLARGALVVADCYDTAGWLRVGEAGRQQLVLHARPILTCDNCDLHLMGNYTPNGRAVFVREDVYVPASELPRPGDP